MTMYRCCVVAILSYTDTSLFDVISIISWDSSNLYSLWKGHLEEAVLIVANKVHCYDNRHSVFCS